MCSSFTESGSLANVAHHGWSATRNWMSAPISRRSIGSASRMKLLRSTSWGAGTVRRLKAEHVEDECAAQDITDVLLDVGRGGAVENPEALGFMLRAFFEGQRRHIAFEREHMLPIAAGLNLLDPSAPFLSLLREAGGALRDGQPSAQTGMADDSPVNGRLFMDTGRGSGRSHHDWCPGDGQRDTGVERHAQFRRRRD